VGCRPRAPSAILYCGPSSVRYSDSGYRKVEVQEYPCSEGHSFGISTGPAAPVGGTSVGYTSTGRDVAERNMPQRKQPVRLEDLAIRLCADRYIGMCERWMGDLTAVKRKGEKPCMSVLERVMNECREVESELSTIPPGLLKLLNPLLVAKFIELIPDGNTFVDYECRFPCDSLRHRSVFAAAFRCVLNRSIERIDILCTSYIVGCIMILQNLDRVPGLLEFNFSNLIEESALVATAIRHVKRLQVFKYPQHCTDDVIFQLRLHCPRLTEVDVSDSANVTNKSARHIIELTKLKWLTLEGTRIDDEEYGFIISKLPNIANIIFWFNESSVLFDTGFKTLDTITHISGYFQELDAVSWMCPNTTNVTLGSSNFLNWGDSNDLSGLTAFSALRALEIYSKYRNESHWRTVFRGIGLGLQDLALTNCANVNLEDIVTLCPSLVNLSLIQCRDLQLNTPLNPQLPHFRNLINLKVKQISGHSVDFRYIRYYVNLKTIHLTEHNIFTVEFLRAIISLGTFKQLEVFRVKERAPGSLTMEALQLLIEHCPLLKRIEGLGRCPKLGIFFIDDLKREILQQNLDLVIQD
jgi:hypothetical protein